LIPRSSIVAVCQFIVNFHETDPFVIAKLTP
jgi:hypothetical protein